jgi:hypothetical protein
MKWLEIVRLRAGGLSDGSLEEILVRIARIKPVTEIVEIRSYRHSEIENDASVHIFWESPRCESDGSNIGHEISDGFKNFGLVDHSVWVEHREKDHE